MHGFLDTQFVDALGKPPSSLAASLLNNITPSQAKEWATGTPEDWAREAFGISVADVYGNPPLSKDETQHLDSDYVTKVEKDVKLQLSRAGVRLAFFLNQTLGSEQADWDSCLSSTVQPQHSATRARKSPRRRH